MDDTIRAYGAGYFDGEGTIGIRVENRILPKGAGISRVHVLQIAIGSTDVETLRWFAEQFGGAVRGPVTRHRAQHKPIYFWQAGASTAERVLRELYPFLRNKRPQAEVAFALRETTGRKWLRVPDEVMAERDRLKERITALNQRGVAA